MISLNISNRQIRQPSNALPSHATSQKVAKLLDSNGLALFSKTLNDVQAGSDASQLSRAQAVTGPARHNIVTTASNSSIITPAPQPAPPPPPPPVPASNSIVPATTAGNSAPSSQTMTKEQARIILATGKGDVVTANQIYYGTQTGSGSQGPSTPVSPAGPPPLYGSGQILSTDPAVFTASNYIQGINLSGYQQQANWENTRRYDNYLNQFQNWKLNGSQGDPPAPPKYETVDQAGFQNWWAQYQASFASGNPSAPDLGMFLANAPSYTKPLSS